MPTKPEVFTSWLLYKLCCPGTEGMSLAEIGNEQKIQHRFRWTEKRGQVQIGSLRGTKWNDNKQVALVVPEESARGRGQQGALWEETGSGAGTSHAECVREEGSRRNLGEF